jgi:hypothetical protein
MSKIPELLRELSKEMPGVGIILIPENEDIVQTNISMIKEGSMVMQHMVAFLHLMNNKELYDEVLDSFERAGKDLRRIQDN